MTYRYGDHILQKQRDGYWVAFDLDGNEVLTRTARKDLVTMLDRADTDHCIACGSDDLFSGFFGADGLAQMDDSIPGVRYTTFCNRCGSEQV